MDGVKTIDELYNNLLQRQKVRMSSTPDIGEISARSRNEGKLDLTSFSPVSSVEAYKTLSDGSRVAMYEDFLPGADNNERYAQSQSALEQAFNGTVKALNNTAGVIVGNTAGFIYGISELTRTGNLNSLYDNSFTRTADDINTKLNYQLPNYYTKDSQEGGFLGQLIENPTNTIFNDIFNGISFTVGTVASEAIWAYATGGSSLALRAGQWGAKLGNIGKWGKLFLGAEKTAEGLVKYKGIANSFINNAVRTGKISLGTAKALAGTANAINTARFIATSSGNEAGIEAFHFKKEATENFYHNFEKMYGREPNAEEVAKFTSDVEEASVGVFKANMAILGISNLAMIGNMFNIKSPMSSLQKDLNKKLFGIGREFVEGSWKAIEATKLQKVARGLYIPVSTTLREGAFEEAGQGMATKTANLWIERRYDPKYINQTIDMMDLATEAAREQYLTQEGQKDIWIGGIVGLLGGSVTGEFSRFKKETETQKNIASSLNAQENLATTLVADINARRLSTTALQLESQDRSEKEFNKGNVVSAKLAQYDGIIAGWQLEDSFGDSKELTDKLQLAIDTSEVSAEEKDSLKEGLNQLYETYKTASANAEAIVGKQGRIYGTQYSSQLAKEALTYVLVQGENANQLMQELRNEMNPYLDSELGSAIDLSESLSLLDKDTRKQLKNASQRQRYLDKKIQAVKKRVSEIQATPNEVAGDKQSRLVEMQSKLIEFENQKAELRAEVETIGGKIKQNNKLFSSLNQTKMDGLDMTGEFIAVEDLLNLDEKLNRLEEVFSTMQREDPTNATILKDLMDKYQEAKKAMLNYNSASSIIAQGNFKPTLANDNPFKAVFDKFTKSEEKADNFTLDFLTELASIHTKSRANYLGENQEGKLITKKKRLEELSKKTADTLTEDEVKELQTLIEDIAVLESAQEVEVVTTDDTPTKQDFINKKVAKLQAELDSLEDTPENKNRIINLKRQISKLQPQDTTQPLDVVEALKKKIQDILDNFEAEFVGDSNLEDKIKDRPDQKDIDRYRELKQSREIQDYENLGQLPLETNLLDEYNELKRKLSQWRVFDSLVLNSGESVADLLDQLAVLETQVAQEETVVDAEPLFEDDLAENKSEKRNDFTLTQNTNFPPTVKVKDNGTLFLTHLKIEDIISRYQGVENIQVNGKKAKDLSKLKLGDVVKFKGGGQDVTFKISVGMGIETTLKDFQTIPNIITTNTLTSKITNWSYSVLYEVDNNGEVVPMKSSFADDTISGHTSDLKEGENIELFVDINHPFNKELLEDFDKGIITEDDVRNKVLVHLRKNGQNYQTLKGLEGRIKKDENGKDIPTMDSDKIVEIRKVAKDFLLSSNVSGQIGVTKINKVVLGVPILTLTQNGSRTTVPITENGVKNIVATGFIKDGELVLNKELEDVRKSYVSKASKGVKVPIVVIKQGKQLIAFPVKMNKVSTPKTDDLVAVMQDMNMSDAQKVVAINKLLVANKISPRQFDLVSLDEQEKLERVNQALSEVETFRTADELADENYKIENLIVDAEISLDLEDLNKYLPSQKLLISFDDVNLKAKQATTNNEDVTDQVNAVLSNIEFTPKPNKSSLTISDEEYQDFRDNRVVSESRMEVIADKMFRGKTPTLRELEMFAEKTSEINALISQKKDLSLQNIVTKPVAKVVKPAPKENVLVMNYGTGSTTEVYRKTDGNWYFKDSKGKEQKDNAKSQEFFTWLYNNVELGSEIDNDRRKELKTQFELEKANKDLQC